MNKSMYATDIKHYLKENLKKITFKIIATGMVIELTLIANIILQIK